MPIGDDPLTRLNQAYRAARSNPDAASALAGGHQYAVDEAASLREENLCLKRLLAAVVQRLGGEALIDDREAITAAESILHWRRDDSRAGWMLNVAPSHLGGLELDPWEPPGSRHRSTAPEQSGTHWCEDHQRWEAWLVDAERPDAPMRTLLGWLPGGASETEVQEWEARIWGQFFGTQD